MQMTQKPNDQNLTLYFLIIKKMCYCITTSYSTQNSPQGLLGWWPRVTIWTCVDAPLYQESSSPHPGIIKSMRCRCLRRGQAIDVAYAGWSLVEQCKHEVLSAPKSHGILSYINKSLNVFIILVHFSPHDRERKLTNTLVKKQDNIT